MVVLIEATVIVLSREKEGNGVMMLGGLMQVECVRASAHPQCGSSPARQFEAWHADAERRASNVGGVGAGWRERGLVDGGRWACHVASPPRRRLSLRQV